MAWTQPLPNIKRLRDAKKLTLEQLCEATEISFSQLSRYERGGGDGRDIKLTELQTLARFFRTTVAVLIGEPQTSAADQDQAGEKARWSDTDRILLRVGDLRQLVAEALMQEGLPRAEADAYADGVLGSLAGQTAESAVLRLAESALVAAASTGQEPVDP